MFLRDDPRQFVSTSTQLFPKGEEDSGSLSQGAVTPDSSGLVRGTDRPLDLDGPGEVDTGDHLSGRRIEHRVCEGPLHR